MALIPDEFLREYLSDSDKYSDDNLQTASQDDKLVTNLNNLFLNTNSANVTKLNTPTFTYLNDLGTSFFIPRGQQHILQVATNSANKKEDKQETTVFENKFG